ncbi:MAG TPA: zinc ribbon domain-containing protein [Candidatus Hydrogenedentes bacterium]|nr:zinc ribbon domain-containing protein [Candidatus Hydrogenedentota bacterium]HOS02027.1 zinc ribbon domain-containing protein [Candidatus Hydrogenedentota bacterium]
MPLFTYVCQKCDAVSEALIRSDETPACPRCGSTRMIKQPSAFAPMSGSGRSMDPAPCGAGSCCGSEGGCPFK